ncbi:MAG: nucleoid-associated protein [Bacteroidales bacterium]|nr:nucleoid-associated protein [Bacteroidales bacterium]
MFNFSETKIKKLIVHSIGNKAEEQGIILSNSEIEIKDEAVENILLSYFLKSFKTDEFYHFDLEQEATSLEVMNSVSNIFENEDEFYVQSANIANHLYEVSVHPNIKRGELYFVHLTNCLVGDVRTDAIGIFKSENKDTYIKIFQQNDSFEIGCDNGININKLDKGCLLFNVYADQGYKISIIDKTNANKEALYWKEDFLKVLPWEDNYFITSNFLDLCKAFGEQVLTEDNNVERTEKIDFMNKSIDFFKDNKEFTIDRFNNKVISNDEVVNEFKNYIIDIAAERNFMPPEQFSISENAVKNSKKYFKSVIKLDKNFHVYVHSKSEFIEKGYDDLRKLKYYKLYFDSES